MLEIINVYKTVGSKSKPITILSDISLRINNGEIVAMVGPSGCGKSTLLNTIAGINIPTKGTVLFNDEDIYKMSENKRDVFRNKNIGIVFQNYNLVSELTCYENIILPHIFSNTAKSGKDKVETLSKLLEITHLLDLYPYEMSGGEQQRAAIARAVIQEPQLIVADEPTGALDSKSSKAVLSAFSEMRKHFNCSFIIATHNNDVANYCDRIIKMSDGRLIGEE